MTYEVLARKWRPKQFDEVVGQAHVTRTLRNAIASNRVAHAYLFVGPRGIGKTTLSRILAKALNCEKGPTAEPCDKCDSCLEIADGRSLDVIEFDAASNTQVDKVRELIIERVAYAPARGPYKVYIVDEVHMLSTSSFNALLKTLEEPPPHVKFIFATTEPQKVPTTIASRCQRFDLRRIATRDIISHLAKIAAAESVAIDEDALLAIARGAEGGLRDAESALDQLIAFRGKSIAEEDVLSVFGLVSRRRLEELAGSVLKGDIAGLLGVIADLDANGKDLQRVVIELLEHFRNVLAYQHADGRSQALDVSEAQAGTLRDHAAAADAGKLLRIAEILIDTEGRLRYAMSRRTLLETALIRCARTAASVSIDSVLKQLTALKAALGGAPLPPAAAPGIPRPAAVQTRPAAPVSATPAAADRVREDEPVPASGGGDDLETLIAKWPDVIRRTGTALPNLTDALAATKPLAAAGHGVTIGLDRAQAGSQSALDTPRNRDALQRSIKAVLLRDTAVSFVLFDGPGAAPAPATAAKREATKPAARTAAQPDPAPAPTAPAPAAPEDGPKKNVRKALMEHEGVQNLMKAFGGRITDIHE